MARRKPKAKKVRPSKPRGREEIPPTPLAPVAKAVFLVRSAEHHTQSYTWRVWSKGADFYIKPRFKPVAGFKVSLHGPHPHEGMTGSRWKIASDWRDLRSVLLAGGAFWRGGSEDPFAYDFPGIEITPKIHHVLRIRNAWTTFAPGSPSGPNPGPAKEQATSTHAVARAPGFMRCGDIDFYLSETGRPYWPEPKRTADARSRLAWLTNTAGQHLTMVSWGHSAIDDPSPSTLQRGPAPRSNTDKTRAIATVIDDHGLLWIEEVVASHAALLALPSEAPPHLENG